MHCWPALPQKPILSFHLFGNDKAEGKKKKPFSQLEELGKRKEKARFGSLGCDAIDMFGHYKQGTPRRRFYRRVAGLPPIRWQP